jgi:acyl dehydratase
MKQYKVTGKYFDELEVGQEFITPSRTITESDVGLFAGLTGDYNPMHTDEEFAKKSAFGGRIVHGLLGLSIANSLFFRLGIEDGTANAFLAVEWTFKAPIRINDTIHAEVVISEMRESRSRPDQGIVTMDVSVLNQKGDVVQQGKWIKMMDRRP